MSRPRHRHAPRDRRPLVLLTGFGPFPNVPTNASATLVAALGARAPQHFPGYRLRTEILPTEWRAAPARVAQVLGEETPALAIHFGVSSKARGFVIETRGANRARSSADACGLMPDGLALVPGGLDALPVTLPVGRILERLRRRGLRAYPSRDAGGYLCNAVLYQSLSAIRGVAGSGRCGFVHIPARLGWATLSGPGEVWAGYVAGGFDIIAASLGLPTPAPSDLSRTASTSR